MCQANHLPGQHYPPDWHKRPLKLEQIDVPPEQPRTPKLDIFYHGYLGSQDTAGFIRDVARDYTVATLQRLVSHGKCESRRGGVLALGFLGTYDSNAVLGRALNDEDRVVRNLAEHGIRSLWQRAGTELQQQRLQQIIRLIASGNCRKAVRLATALVEQAPWFAEAWNQRAIAYHCLGRFAESVRDCSQALEINPYHFGAAIGMGHCYLSVNNRVSALESFRRAYRVNSNLEAVRLQVVRLEKLLKRES